MMKGMNRPLACLLILTTLWMATWLVTDVHVPLQGGDHQSHPLFSFQVETGKPVPSDDAGGGDSCHFCSDDHGGHVGGMALPPAFFLAVTLVPRLHPPPYHLHFSPRIQPPVHRPPIV